MDKKVKEAIKTIEAHAASCAEGDRHLVVLDRGWIFAGNMSLDADTKTYTLADCYNVRKWEKGGFGALSKSAKEAKAILDKAATLRFHVSAMIFAVPIGRDWDE